ncbi:neutral zinc metallopeptidase [Paragemmobacter straminiformis]|uniref:Neutral zinc metallopeptidase n=1 Tax=Paragemmobacter straminiformis TaxID=2045119 RepID=A0A842I6U5_9RHOB|nr:neutral zinc metallopeptidase [Gemmobacter straminiformis]MBC2835359.1 neutral zinc metallopeptidase [Gemmobacter straminiformis]
MEWRGRRGSGNIEDRRRMGGGGRAGVGGIGVIAVVLIGWFFGVDLTPLLQEGGPVSTQGQPPRSLTAADREIGDFVSVTLADTEEVWQRLFREQVGQDYRPVTLVLFSGSTGSGCGTASEASGPFYCPVDKKVYLDTDFFGVMQDQLGAGGDFAAAYVVAHEIGHHVQDELGILEQTTRLRQSMSEADSNAVSVRVELMADCLAGVWANAAQAQFGSVEAGDVQEAMNAASRIGDDTLQRAAGRRPVPDSFTHGSSAQRVAWFRTGQKSGLIESCDTFGSDTP